jgi:hypothetical protein
MTLQPHVSGVFLLSILTPLPSYVVEMDKIRDPVDLLVSRSWVEIAWKLYEREKTSPQEWCPFAPDHRDQVGAKDCPVECPMMQVRLKHLFGRLIRWN